MNYTYYEGDGTLLRAPDPRMMIDMEIYRGNGIWEPYEAGKELYLTRPVISEDKAKIRMDFMDGKGVLSEWDDDAEAYMPVEDDDDEQDEMDE